MCQHVYTVGRLTVESGAAEIHFSTPHVDFFDFDPPHRGGGGYLTPSLPVNAILTLI